MCNSTMNTFRSVMSGRQCFFFFEIRQINQFFSQSFIVKSKCFRWWISSQCKKRKYKSTKLKNQLQHLIARTKIRFKRIVYNHWFQFNLCHWTSNNLPNKENILTKNVQWIPFRILMFYFVCHTNLQSMNVSNNQINKSWKLFFVHAFRTSLHYREGTQKIRCIISDFVTWRKC